MLPPTRRGAARAVAITVCAVATAVLGTSPAHADGPSAALSVSVAVVRACTVATPALVAVGDELVRAGAAARAGDAVSLRCSEGEGGNAVVHVGSDVLTILF